MAPYEYSALDEEASEIRLMTLLPGRFKDDISITMETVVLTKEHTPQYEALSYVWGSPENPVDISVKAWNPERSNLLPSLALSRRRSLVEASMHGTISVTQNLATALPYLRKEDKLRVLWIDAICVNQQDLAERACQVKRMADVYSMASRVIIWLGIESQNSTLALRAIDQFGSQMRVDWILHTITSVSTGETITQGKIPFDAEIWNAVGDVLHRPWFKRLWIWQEVRLAREAYLLCGNEGVLWESVRNVIYYSMQLSADPERIGRLIRRCFRTIDYQANVEVYPLDHILHDARSASCSDSRDKVFGVLSLASERHTRGIDVDYTKTAEASFRDLVLHFASNLQTLDILTHCELRDDTGGMKLPTWVPNDGMKLPTWVPDWTVPRLCARIFNSLSCLHSKPRVRYQDGRVLAATGVQVAVIKRLESFPQPTDPDGSVYREDFEDAIRALIVPKIKSLSLSERDATVNSLCRTLCCNYFADRYSPPAPIAPDFEIGRQYIHRIIDTTQDSALDGSYECRKYRTHAITSIRIRSFFTTYDGSIGLAPIATQPNDEVCILLGCQSPLVLRPCGDGYYKVVGECYIDGFTNGAAVLGPLPSNWQLVGRYFEEYLDHHNVFLNHQTGEFQPEDPRLGPLPAGWYISDHRRKDAWIRYANYETGKVTHFDPRMTPEALRARGVEMREFQLV